MEDRYISIRKKTWKDLEDNNHIYREGDIYPREGLEVSKKRIKELSSIKNKIGEVLIMKVETEEPKEEGTETTENVVENREENTENTEENKEDTETTE